MKKHFKDALAVKERKASYNYVAPTKEQATTGRFMSPGDRYGVGHRQPIGTFKASSESPIPQKSMCFSADDAI